MNAILRDLDDGSSLDKSGLARVDQMIEDLDDAIEAATTPFAVEVHRGVRDVASWLTGDLGRLVGMTFTDPGFMSTSLDRDSAYHKVQPDRNPAIFTLRVPAGQHVAWLPLVGKKALRNEYELLLPRNTTVRIKGISTYRGMPMIMGEVI